METRSFSSVDEAATMLAKTAAVGMVRRSSFVKQADPAAAFKSLTEWFGNLPPEAQGALVGAGGGGLFGLLSSFNKDEDERNTLGSTLTGGLAGGLLGGGTGVARRWWPVVQEYISAAKGEKRPVPVNMPPAFGGDGPAAVAAAPGAEAAPAPEQPPAQGPERSLWGAFQDFVTGKGDKDEAGHRGAKDFEALEKQNPDAAAAWTPGEKVDATKHRTDIHQKDIAADRDSRGYDVERNLGINAVTAATAATAHAAKIKPPVNFEQYRAGLQDLSTTLSKEVTNLSQGPTGSRPYMKAKADLATVTRLLGDPEEMRSVYKDNVHRGGSKHDSSRLSGKMTGKPTKAHFPFQTARKSSPLFQRAVGIGADLARAPTPTPRPSFLPRVGPKTRFGIGSIAAAAPWALSAYKKHLSPPKPYEGLSKLKLPGVE